MLISHFTKLFLLLIGLGVSGCVVEPVRPYHPYYPYDYPYHSYYPYTPVYYDPVIYPYWGWPNYYHHHHRHWR